MRVFSTPFTVFGTWNVGSVESDHVTHMQLIWPFTLQISVLKLYDTEPQAHFKIRGED
jgi:hypothetical protein